MPANAGVKGFYDSVSLLLKIVFEQKLLPHIIAQPAMLADLQTLGDRPKETVKPRVQKH